MKKPCMKSHTWHKIFCLFTCLLDSGVHYAVLMALLFLLIKLNQIIYAFSEAPETASTEWVVSSGVDGFVLADAPETASASLLFADSLVFSEAPETPSTLLSFFEAPETASVLLPTSSCPVCSRYQSRIGQERVGSKTDASSCPVCSKYQSIIG